MFLNKSLRATANSRYRSNPTYPTAPEFQTKIWFVLIAKVAISSGVYIYIYIRMYSLKVGAKDKFEKGLTAFKKYAKSGVMSRKEVQAYCKGDHGQILQKLFL